MGSRMEISYKVGVGLPAYEVIDRTYGKKVVHFGLY